MVHGFRGFVVPLQPQGIQKTQCIDMKMHLKHINSCIKCHFYILQVWQPIYLQGLLPTHSLLQLCMHFVSSFRKIHQIVNYSYVL